MHRIKQGVMQEEVRIIFNSNISSTHWTNTLRIVSESMLVQNIKLKPKHKQYFNTKVM